MVEQLPGQRNSEWQSEVYSLLRRGLGSEDIAVLLECPLVDVHREIQILRDSGDLARLYRVDVA